MRSFCILKMIGTNKMMHSDTFLSFVRFGCVAFACLGFMASAFAQTPPPIPLNLSQPASAPKIGDVTVPFGWNIRNEGDERIVAIEADANGTPSNAPAVITVDMISTPAELPTSTVAENIVVSLAEALDIHDFALDQITKSDLCLDEKPTKKCKNQVQEMTVSLEGKENDLERTCHAALYVVDKAHRIVVFTLCGPSAKQYDPEPLEALKTMFKQMQ